MRAQYIVAAIALLLASCAGIFPAPQTPAQAVYEAKAAFLVALRTADDYAALPRCPAQPVCSDAATIAAIETAAKAAQASLDAAQAVVTDSSLRNGDVLQKAIAAANGAVSAFAAVTARLPVQQKAADS
ncbi:MAG TPA: hypothetical protein VG891_13355 [Rhizomicrobium sp.]|nr:hypothetical protein [Rhizomicrobium sp.]